MPEFRKLMNFSLALLAAAGFTGPVQADSTLIEASRDNTLYENAEGALSNGAGERLFAGVTETGFARRTLLRFDLSDTGATGDQLTLNFTQNQRKELKV